MYKGSGCKEVDDLINNHLTKKLLRYTVQLYHQVDNTFKPYGSGILVKTDNDYFVFTASHVIGEEEYVHIRIGMKHWLGLGGDINCTDIEKSNGLDLSFVKLDKNVVPILEKTYSFLEISKISTHNQQLTDGANYCVLGFPEKNYSIENGVVNTGASCFLLRASNDKPYTYYKVDKKNYFFVNLNGKMTDLFTGKKTKIDAKLYGMSGCGLWFVLYYYDRTKCRYGIDYRLIGIVTDIKKGKYFCLMANRIHHILQGLSKYDIYFREKKAEYVYEYLE